MGTSDSDEEFFSDIDSDLEEEERVRMRQQRRKAAKPKAPPPGPKGYDPSVRDPRHSGADRECTWELLNLRKFFHPSVRVFAENILNVSLCPSRLADPVLTRPPSFLQGVSIEYSGDPFDDFTQIHFLDRFLQKKPKRVTDSRAEAAPDAKALAVNSEEYRNLDEADIPADEKCFYEFSKAQKERKARRKKADVEPEGSGEDADNEEHESIPDEEFDAFLDKFEGKIDEIPLDGLSDDGSAMDLSSGDEEDDASFTMSDLSSDAEEKEEEEEDSDADGDELRDFEFEEDEEVDFDEDNLYESQDEDDEFMEGELDLLEWLRSCFLRSSALLCFSGCWE